MPSRKRFVLLAVAALAALVFASGCKRHETPLSGPEGSLAVAGFEQPAAAAELLGGYLPDGGESAKPQDLGELDEAMRQELAKSFKRTYLGTQAVRQCSETVLSAESGSGKALAHWLAVGRCLGVDWLLVPQLTDWRERQGSDVSVREAASVTMWLYLIDVRGESIARRYKFEETQQPLTDNFLDTGKFFSRGGKWITARDLAREGLVIGLKEMGL